MDEEFLPLQQMFYCGANVFGEAEVALFSARECERSLDEYSPNKKFL